MVVFLDIIKRIQSDFKEVKRQMQGNFFYSV